MADEEPAKKRQRVSKACQQCRRKKIKCIGSPPACGNCNTLGLTCHYLESKKKRGPPKGYMEAIEGRLQRLEALIGKYVQEDDPRSQALLAELNSPLETVHGELVRPRPLFMQSRDLQDESTSMQHLRQDAGDQENPNPPDEGSESNSPRHDQPYDVDDTPGHRHDSHDRPQRQEEADRLDNMSIDDAGQLRYYGKSSGFDVLWNKQTPLSSFHFKARRALDHGTNVDPYALPPQELSDHLLQLYFSNFYPWLPAVHKDSFLQRMASKTDRPPLLLINCVYAAGSLLTTDINVRSDPDRPETAGDIFKERARLLMDEEWDNFNVHTVQALILLSAVQNGSLNSQRGWLYSGMAIRMAQNLGLHRDCSNWHLTDVEKEERKRAFYCCFLADRLSSAMHGRSPLIDERDVDSPLPSHVDQRHDVGADVHLDEFHNLIKLCSLLGDVLRDLYTVRGRKQLSMMTCPDSIVANLDRRLNKWTSQLPTAMRYRPPNTRLAETAPCPPLQLCQIHMMFYTTLILVHRPFIPGSSSSAAPSIFPSASICTFAANKILDIVLSLQDASKLKGCNNYTLYFMFTAGIIFLHNARSKDSSFAFEAKISVNKIMRAMDELESTWATSARHCNILGALAGLRDIDLSNVDQSYSRSNPQQRLGQPWPSQHQPQQQLNQPSDKDGASETMVKCETTGSSLAIAVPNSPDSQDMDAHEDHAEMSPILLVKEEHVADVAISLSALDERYANYYLGHQGSPPSSAAAQRPTSPAPTSSHPPITLTPSPPAGLGAVLGMDSQTVDTHPDLIQRMLSSHPLASDFLSDSPVPFDPDASAFWEAPSSVDIHEWNRYMASLAHKIDPLMHAPVVHDSHSPPSQQDPVPSSQPPHSS
ncbi:hypothetical protein DM01DRAFT_1325367 [Hesseltinella vesiculosa]|uniref:Zn(2)-C6 fungal-type domain-containing protein n=1 Tax=Hesseltinella vesiculosa TaxID=101127 RepID=A0A1X2GBE5_9FUNG|nr:hypothetical protein DM01DRAFT_1325367 [Hesseltinella vesiculosa]